MIEEAITGVYVDPVHQMRKYVLVCSESDRDHDGKEACILETPYYM